MSIFDIGNFNNNICLYVMDLNQFLSLISLIH